MEEVMRILIMNEYSTKYIIPLAQTCKGFLKVSLNRDCLIHLVNMYLAGYTIEIKRLPFFFYASIPEYLIDMPYKINTDIAWRNCCIAGGYIVKKIYDHDYVSDIDIWINSGNDLSTIFSRNSAVEHSNNAIAFDIEDIIDITTNNNDTNSDIEDIIDIKIAGDITKYDIIPTSDDLYKCIINSDLSICQQGIIFDNNNNYIFHLTPLSLYTYYTGTIITTITPLSRTYGRNDSWYTGYSLDYFHKHFNSCGRYVKCFQCESKYISCLWRIKDEYYCNNCGDTINSNLIYIKCSNCQNSININDSNICNKCSYINDRLLSKKYNECDACRHNKKVKFIHSNRINCINCDNQLQNYIYPIYDCTECTEEWNKDDETYNSINEWYTRLKKYNKRFYECDSIYIDKPLFSI